MVEQKQTSRVWAEHLETRRLFASTGTLLQYDFNSANPWPNMAGSTSNGGTAVLVWGGFGTIDTEGGTTPTNAERLTATPPSSGAWVSDLSSGILAVTNTETNLGKLTFSFNLSVTQADPVTVQIFSYNSSTGSPTGELQTTINPAATYYNQRFAIDLSTMIAVGAGAFNPTAPDVSFNYEMNSANGWSAASVCQFRLDNVNYSKPAYYVSPSGNNTTGLTEATAFHTPQQALNVSKAGDIILLMTGTYTQVTANTGAIDVTAGGTPADWIVIKNYPGQTPVISNSAWNAVLIGNGTNGHIATTPAIAYVEIRGLDIVGNAQTANTVYPQYINQGQPQTNGNGISIQGTYETNHPHDIRIADNTIEYNCGAGIGAGECDRVQIENNIVRYNCWWCIYAPSGISVLSAYNFDGLPLGSAPYTRLVRNNTVYGNQDFLVWQSLVPPRYSDGNGIIIDVNHNTSDLPNGVTVGRTLVTNNLSYDNGGGGIHAYNSDHVDIINNVAYMNSASPALQYAEIDGQSDTDVKIYNNILVAPVGFNSSTGEPVNGGSSSFFQNNIYFGGGYTGVPATPVMGSGDRVLDPQFVLPSIDPNYADFHLRSTSPAINMGGGTLAPYLDFAGNARIGAPDIGAYEYLGAVLSIPTTANAVPLQVFQNTTHLNIVPGTGLGPGPYTYSWATTAKPTGATDPVISPSTGTSLTALSTATFSFGGSYASPYTFTVTITDANSVTTTASISVDVFPSTASIAIAPNPKAIAVGTTQQFSATATDQFGFSLNRAVTTWATNSSAGSISSSGLFTASQTAGTYSVSATINNISNTALVTVVPTAYNTSGAGYYVRVAPDLVTEQIWVGTPGSVGPTFNATPTYSILLSSLPSLTFGPAAGSEALTLDLANGTPVPTGGLSFDGGAGTDSLNILGSAGNDSVTVNATQILFGTTPITYANTESVAVNLGAGSDTLTQAAQPGNAATLTMINPTTSDSLIISSGIFSVPAATSGITRVSLGSLNVSSGAKVILTAATPHSTRNVLAIGTLILPSTATLDLGGNDLIVSSTASNLNADVLAGQNTGTGLITSAPVGNALRAIGIVTATTGQSFDGQSPTPGDTLIKVTYFGDATLDGKVDGSDYSKIDNSYLIGGLSGWANGDFNYDGVINGSDYTLIDNAFNMQGASFSAEFAKVTTHVVQPVNAITLLANDASQKKRVQSIAQTLEQMNIL